MTSYLEPLMGILPNSTGMVPGWIAVFPDNWSPDKRGLLF